MTERTRSPIETMPTIAGAFDDRKVADALSVISRMHSSTVCDGDTVMTGVVMISATRVSFDDRDCSTTFRA